MRTLGIRAWHPGQLVIAWILLLITGSAIGVAWFNLLDPVGHGNYPQGDERACLRTGPRNTKARDALVGMDSSAITAYGVSLADLSIQLGYRIGDTARFRQLGGTISTMTPATDTDAMFRDLSKFRTHRDSVDSLVETAYFAARGLRIDQDCMRRRYADANKRISALNSVAVVLILALPFIGLWMTWVWFGARVRREG